MFEIPLEEIIANNPIAPEEVVSWLKIPVTKVFLDCIEVERDMCNEDTHNAIEKIVFDDAVAANAGMKTCERILEIPEIIVEYLNDLNREPENG